MRNLTYPEASLCLTVIALATGLAYVAWFEPALAEMRNDRRATRTLLFQLAASTERAAMDEPAGSSTATRPAQAFRPASHAPTSHLPKTKRRPPPKRAPNGELELGSSDDPLEGLDPGR